MQIEMVVVVVSVTVARVSYHVIRLYMLLRDDCYMLLREKILLAKVQDRGEIGRGTMAGRYFLYLMNIKCWSVYFLSLQHALFSLGWCSGWEIVYSFWQRQEWPYWLWWIFRSVYLEILVNLDSASKSWIQCNTCTW